MTKGLVIGKFYPPHKGHSYLIETALAQCDMVDVLVCDSPAYKIPAKQRADWLQRLHPSAEVSIIKDIGKDDDSEAWAKYTLMFLGYKPDTVFTSEDYGDAYAKAMDCQHVMVDKQRKTVPVAARQIRADVLSKWQFMEPLVRQPFCRRVCVVGAESTGTTTLAKALAEYYQTFWVQEFGRFYSESKLTAGPCTWDSDEFKFIADQQNQQEDYLAGQSNGLLICDTNSFATRLWHKAYMGEMLPELDEIAGRNTPDLYILTSDEIPYEQDGTRDGKAFRHQMHEWFLEELKKQAVPFILVTGNHKNRLRKAVNKIDELNKKVVNIQGVL